MMLPHPPTLPGFLTVYFQPLLTVLHVYEPLSRLAHKLRGGGKEGIGFLLHETLYTSTSQYWNFPIFGTFQERRENVLFCLCNISLLNLVQNTNRNYHLGGTPVYYGYGGYFCPLMCSQWFPH